eukprot:s1003_g13.t1
MTGGVGAKPSGYRPRQQAASASDCAALVSNAIYQRPGERSPHVDGVQAYTAQLYQHGPLNLVVSEPKLPMRNLLVLQISNSPAIQAWNFMNPYQRIEVGHAIMAVNGKTDPYEMLQELATAQTLNLFIKDKMTRVQQRHFEESLQKHHLMATLGIQGIQRSEQGPNACQWI